MKLLQDWAKVGGGAMKVARSGHGALRWYDSGGGRCGGPHCESGRWHGGFSHTGWLLRVHGGERWWGRHVDRGIVGGVALGRHGLSHSGGFAPRALASNHGCLEGFGGLENRRNGFLEHALSITRALNESTKCLCK